MKLYKIIIAILCVLPWFSCEEDMGKAVLREEVVQNTLNALPATDYVLLFDNGSENFDAFGWTVPDFGFDATVNYTLQMDVAGADFANAAELATTTSPTASLTVGQINSVLLGLGLTPGEAAEVEFRVISSVSSSVEPVYSNVLGVTITPYSTTFPPIYIIGDAQGWDLAQAAELTSTGPGTYEGLASFVNDGTFRFFATPSWDAEQWNANFFDGGTLPAELENAGDGDSNFRFLGDDGLYQVTVDLNAKTIVMAAGSIPTLYIIGDDQDWNLQTPLQMNNLGGGEFEAIGEFTSGSIFRFFEIPDWSAVQYNYNTIVDGEGTLPEILSGTTEGDANFTFNGETGVYIIRINLNDLVIKMNGTEEPELFIIGDDQDWTLGSAYQMTWLGGGLYEGTTDFTNGSIFRFFEAADWAAPQYNYNYFLEGTIDETHLSGVTEGDANLSFTGESGTYTIRVNLYNQSVMMTP